MKLIINADDFGQDEDTLLETIRSFEAGSLSSATIMVTMPFAKHAMEFAKANTEFSFGVHLTFVRENEDSGERPASEPRSVACLVDADGRFRVSGDVRRAAMKNALNVDEISKEIDSQIQKALDHGVRVSHVDSHGHLHKFKPFVAALKQSLPKFGVKRVRTVQDIYLKVPWKSPTFWLGPSWRRDIKRSFETTDHLYLPTSTWDDDWQGTLLEKVSTGILEVGVHPGTLEAWRQSESEGAKRLAQLARQRNITLTNWRDF